jgi:hypothetical protein
MFTSLLLPFNGNYHPVAECIFYFKDKEQGNFFNCFALVKKTKNHYIKHDKTLCNLIVYYIPLLSSVLQVEQNKNNMIYFKPFFIVRINVQDISILSTFISNVTYTFFPY